MLIANQTVQDVYADITRKLPPTERLQLATLILNGQKLIMLIVLM